MKTLPGIPQSLLGDRETLAKPAGEIASLFCHAPPSTIRHSLNTENSDQGTVRASPVRPPLHPGQGGDARESHGLNFATKVGIGSVLVITITVVGTFLARRFERGRKGMAVIQKGLPQWAGGPALEEAAPEP